MLVQTSEEEEEEEEEELVNEDFLPLLTLVDL